MKRKVHEGGSDKENEGGREGVSRIKEEREW